ncbi:Naphthalene 1,2-dioxygenase system ferredoxin--NAD(P)(+), reductase component [Zhongshania aliphaticivorans]|uniref:Naphthalene 1,2-dioxygenase system ferredoxin--NAD(P)(+), reductase component n=1 Tax=Zhongshania aliphaticivorans TaxID=1470434 RepID=A0A5S9QLK1_9GAMM|nr:2Fe-2S iron-sulfur cluster binding domain-containing protein [Zhongshania aliphaticivorans]CAA0087513.1 Naphthalene 1,2-dioxygenase system ferredoxin--NAD(P)(+), reductase component [Zhongshania aliphaticivorans]CAA0115027.1 Naphthalene 1,2-dioxygenase system ferredoxin--NAD(P)(+), reductase component [Zhongshania aliphaticivorans]CAA0119838.1 Naphthalene 1,2-dioxygenase system ferredoxin--NAD(P)(+), reductase component [Zhongshania aliphaticivorans]
MPYLHYQNQIYSCLEDESVLDTLLRHKVSIPYGCRSGACQACMLQTDSKSIPAESTQGLSSQHIRQGHFLACRCIPKDDMTLSCVDLAAQKIPATVGEKFLLDDKTLCLRLHSRIRWLAGQYITLWLNDAARCYSIASVARLDPFIELHIHLHQNGLISKQLLNTAEVGDTLEIQGPLGDFSYRSEQADQKLLLVGAGTGIAPLIGIARDALNHNHTAEIEIISVSSDGHCYAEQQLHALQNDNPQFSFETCPKNELNAKLTTLKSDLRNQRIYLCGGENFVTTTRKKCFMLGASPRNIICEEYINFTDQTGADSQYIAP